ncbi:MAG: DUF4062 domain-containing protein [Pseudomonadota bacterium]|nr:DUF4062 domain-containing protein [Pseudomonadota bacterium]
MFISSVIEGFEEFRRAAKEAVETASMIPIMVEDLNAQPYSSEQVCTKGMQDSDLVLLLLGQRYGSVPDGNDISVTHTEYKGAIKMHKPVLSFVQNIESDPNQSKFLKEVEDYRTGHVRTKFSNSDELKRQIMAALGAWKNSQTSHDATDFRQRVDKALAHERSTARSDDLYAAVAFWGQPEQELNLDEIKCDDEFIYLCKLDIMLLKNGYSNGNTPNGHYKLIHSDTDRFGDTHRAKAIYYDDGLTLLIFTPKCHSRLHICFISPSEFELVVKNALHLNRFNSSWAMLGLYNMKGNVYFAEPVGDTNSTSSNIPFRHGARKQKFCHLFNPMTKGAYLNWVESRINYFKREFGLPANGH